MKAERKFEEPFEFIPFCRLVFSANHYPQSKDASQGFFRRWLVIPFERTFEGKEKIPRPILDARLAQPGELSGVLNKALAALPAIAQRGGFAECRSAMAAEQEFRERTDPIAAWLDRETAFDSNGYVAKRDLLIRYQAYSQAQEWPTISAKAFGQAFKRARPQITEGQRTIGGELREVWIGLRLIHDGR
jgi:putative DNA primase/helicase